MADIAQVFGGDYRAYADDVAQLQSFATLIALENLPSAQSVYGYRPAPNGPYAVMVGNEAKGVRRATLKQADAVVEIPIPSRSINCLNVAAAAAVVLYYFSLTHTLSQKAQTVSRIGKQRPDLLLLGGTDHLALGSTIRSACAFGWDRITLDDRKGIWYECDRAIKSEGRGAARRGRNPIRVIPAPDHLPLNYQKIIVATTKSGGTPLSRLSLTGHPDTLIVLEDESESQTPWSPPEGFDGDVVYASLPPVSSEQYHYHQLATIALAEISRQLGYPASESRTLPGSRRYRKEWEAAEDGIVLTLDDLSVF